MNAKQCIEYLNDYFVGKLMTGDYTLNKVDHYLAEVEIDGYKFSIWLANGVSSFKCYKGTLSFMDLTFSNDEKEFIHNKLIDIRKQKVDEKRIAELEHELRMLKAQTV